MRRIPLALTLLVLFLFASFASRATTTPDKNYDPEALRVLEEANAALLAVEGLAYEFEFIGTGTTAGRMTGQVMLQRANGGIRYRADLNVVQPVAPMKKAGRFTVASDGGRLWKWSASSEHVETGTFSGGGGALANGAFNALIPQLFRQVPLGIEMEQP